MAGAKITLVGNEIVINGNKTGKKVNANMSEAQVRAQVRAAKTYAAVLAGSDAEAKAIARLSHKPIWNKLHPGEKTKATPKKRERKPTAKGKRKPTKKTKPKPTITTEWIVLQVRAARKGDRQARNAIDKLHKNSAYSDQFFGRGIPMTATQKAVSIAVFNELYQIPRFRLFLSSIAAQSSHVIAYGQYMELQKFLTSPDNKDNLLTDAASYEIITAANSFARYYLLNYAMSDNGTRYRQEIEEIPSMKWRLENADQAMKMKPKGLTLTETDRSIIMRTFGTSGSMDADTVTAASLYIRRWHLENPKKGKGKSQSQIKVWKAPDVIEVEAPVEAVAQPAAEEPAKPVELTPLQQFAEKEWTNLSTEIFNAASKGKPEAILTITENVPEGYTFESALGELKRKDVNNAFDMLFNEYLSKDPEFRRFVRTKEEYRGLLRTSVQLTETSSAGDRRLIARAAQDFLNYTANRAVTVPEDAWITKLDQDLHLLYDEVLVLKKGKGGINSDGDINRDGVADMRTISALAVYQWRRTHPNSAVGEWAQNIAGIKIPEQPTAPVDTTKEKEKSEQKRVLQFR